MARPRKHVDERALIAMAERGWDAEQIAVALGVSGDTIRRRFADKIEEAKRHGKAKLLDILWQRAVTAKSDKVLCHLADRILGKVPTKIELTDEIIDSYLSQKQAADADTKGLPGKKEE